MKLKVFYEKQVAKAMAHWEEHPISGSAKRNYNACVWQLNEYLEKVKEYESKRSNSNLGRA